jgi:SNF2 family DNA or RNA helicase
LNLRLEASSVKEAAGVDEKDTSADVVEEDDGGLATQPFEEALTPPSPKVTALIEVLMKAEDDKNLKAAVFSQFTSFLNVIGRHLDHAGIKFSRLDGGMSMKKRTTELSHWRTLNSAAASTSVFLISTKAGGQGLNLTQGSRVYLMDPL